MKLSSFSVYATMLHSFYKYVVESAIYFSLQPSVGTAASEPNFKKLKSRKFFSAEDYSGFTGADCPEKNFAHAAKYNGHLFTSYKPHSEETTVCSDRGFFKYIARQKEIVPGSRHPPPNTTLTIS